MRPRSLDELVGQEHLLGEGSTLRTAIETGEPHSMILYGPPGAGKTTLARIVASGRARRVRGGVGGQRRPRRGPGHDRARRGAPAGHRPADDLLPRRDPPLQQGPAGRAAARGRGGARDPDRGDDREPLLRGQLRAALAAARSTSCARSTAEQVRELLERALADPERGIADPPPVDRRGARPARRARRRRRAHRARGARARGRGGARASGAPIDLGASPRTRCSARRSASTSRATSTTTTPPR